MFPLSRQTLTRGSRPLLPTPKRTAYAWCALLIATSCFAWMAPILSGENDAHARPRILRPGTRAAVFIGGIGGDVGLNAGGGNLVLHHTIGYHFSGDSSGAALGGDLDLLIGGGGGFGIALGPRFWYDIQIANMAIYVTPYIRPAIVLNFGGSVQPAINIQFGARGKVILNNRAVLFLELTGIGINIVPTQVGTFVFAHLRMMFGAGVTF